MRMRWRSRRDATDDDDNDGSDARVGVVVAAVGLAFDFRAAAPRSRVSTTAASMRTTTSLSCATCSRRSSCFTSIARMASARRAISSSALWMREDLAWMRAYVAPWSNTTTATMTASQRACGWRHGPRARGPARCLERARRSQSRWSIAGCIAARLGRAHARSRGF